MFVRTLDAKFDISVAEAEQVSIQNLERLLAGSESIAHRVMTVSRCGRLMTGEGVSLRRSIGQREPSSPSATAEMHDCIVGRCSVYQCAHPTYFGQFLKHNWSGSWRGSIDCQCPRRRT